MFTGIIESIGTVSEVISEGTNRIFWITSPLSGELKPDQSLSHNGVCLTVDQLGPGRHRVTAVAETLVKTDLSNWEAGKRINLERSLLMSSRLDGHFVQGHVDCRATCIGRKDLDGSWEFQFSFPSQFAVLVIEKGSIAVNGISLTAYDVQTDRFSVAIIPYTFEHTNLHQLQAGDKVNIEFDLIGKYLQRKLTIE